MRSDEECERSEDDAVSFRLGSAAVGLLGGGVFGFVLAVVVAVGLGYGSLFAPLVFGCAALGAVAGYLHGSLGFGVAEGAVHFVLGLFTGITERVVNPMPKVPLWLKALYWLGLILGIVFLLRYWWW